MLDKRSKTLAILKALEPSGQGHRRFALQSPATGEAIGEFEVTSSDEVHAAIERARIAQRAWGALDLSKRADIVQAALQILIRKQDEFIDRIVLETGRSRMETVFMEIFPACDSLNYFSRRAAKMLRPESVGLHLLRMKSAKIVYQPLGVVGVISPWNGPFILSLNPCVQALLAGNAVVLKPSEITPFSGKLVLDLFLEAGLPENVLQVVLGDGSTGAALVDSTVDKISFTGSVETGRKIGAICGHNLTHCTLELGGKDAMIVCADADLQRTVGGALFGGFLNAGQFCCGTERVYVVEAVADAFIEQLVAKTAELRLGTSGDFDIACFISERQIEIVEGHIQDAIEKGAKVLIGGKRASQHGENFFEPTVLVDVSPDMLIMSEETFGPVLPVVICADEAAALGQANASKYGLSGSVWTKNKEKGFEIARCLETGSVCVNDTGLSYGALELPFGGRKQSGLGHVHGANALRNYCHAHPIITDRFGLKREHVWYPYTADGLSGLQKALKYIWGTTIRRLM
jgi:acyl-CoA reductase-like NAD-dependent aldehyde dehydrogenase